VLDHVRTQLNEDDYRTRALLQFASEEAKHIQLFKKFAEEFQEGFVTNCETIGPPEEIGKAVLSHRPLGVALVILGIEWATQKHYSRAFVTTANSIRNSRACCVITGSKRRNIQA
jgi:hypothetical protein